MDVGAKLNSGTAQSTRSRVNRERPPFDLGREWLFLAFTALLVIANANRASSDLSTEYKVKAAYLYNFTKFVSWPASSAAPEHGSIQICIHGDNPFGAMLTKSVKGRRVRGRSIEVREVDLDGVTSCHLLFISSSEKTRLSEILAVLPAKGMLTVGESEGFLAAGGGIEFVIERDRVRFRINLVPVNRSELSVDSRLLALAASVLKDTGAPR